jgi:hypothetical protein
VRASGRAEAGETEGAKRKSSRAGRSAADCDEARARTTAAVSAPESRGERDGARWCLTPDELMVPAWLQAPAKAACGRRSSAPASQARLQRRRRGLRQRRSALSRRGQGRHAPLQALAVASLNSELR